MPLKTKHTYSQTQKIHTMDTHTSQAGYDFFLCQQQVSCLMHLQSNVLQLIMPYFESRDLDTDTLLFSLAGELQKGGHQSTWGKNRPERTASNNVRGSRLRTSLPHGTDHTKEWSLWRVLIPSQTQPRPWCCRNTPDGERSSLPPPQLLPSCSHN